MERFGGRAPSAVLKGQRSGDNDVAWDWGRIEVEVVVEGDFSTLNREVRGVPYNNQEQLREGGASRLARASARAETVRGDVECPASVPAIPDTLALLGQPPAVQRGLCRGRGVSMPVAIPTLACSGTFTCGARGWPMPRGGALLGAVSGIAIPRPWTSRRLWDSLPHLPWERRSSSSRSTNRTDTCPLSYRAGRFRGGERRERMGQREYLYRDAADCEGENGRRGDSQCSGAMKRALVVDDKPEDIYLLRASTRPQ